MSCIASCFQWSARASGRWLLIVSGLLLFECAGQAENTLPLATNLWVVKLPAPNTGSVPALAPDGTVYTGLFDGSMMAVSPAGKTRWRFKTGLEIESSPAIGDDGTIYFGSRDRHFYALTPAGTLKWQFATGGWVDSSPAIAGDGTVYFGSWDKTFYALNPDGTVKWKFPTGGIVDSSPAVAADGTIYFGSHDQYFYALNPDGSVRWKFKSGGEIVSSPAIGADGVIYFTSLDGSLYALNPDGTARWRLHTGNWTRTSPVLDTEGQVIIGVTNGIDTVSADGGKIHRRWADFMVGGSAAVVPGRIYVALSWFSLFAIAPDGHTLWRANLDGHNVTASPTIGPDGCVYVCAGSLLFAIQPPDETLPPANSPWPMFRANPRHTGRVGK